MAKQASESKTIRFLKHWQGRKRGDLNSNLTPGVMQTLVDHGTAEWVKRGNRIGTKNTQRNVRRQRRTNSRTVDSE